MSDRGTPLRVGEASSHAGQRRSSPQFSAWLTRTFTSHGLPLFDTFSTSCGRRRTKFHPFDRTSAPAVRKERGQELSADSVLPGFNAGRTRSAATSSSPGWQRHWQTVRSRISVSSNRRPGWSAFGSPEASRPHRHGIGDERSGVTGHPEAGSSEISHAWTPSRRMTACDGRCLIRG